MPHSKDSLMPHPSSYNEQAYTYPAVSERITTLLLAGKFVADGEVVADALASAMQQPADIITPNTTLAIAGSGAVGYYNHNARTAADQAENNRLAAYLATTRSAPAPTPLRTIQLVQAKAPDFSARNVWSPAERLAGAFHDSVAMLGYVCLANPPLRQDAPLRQIWQQQRDVDGPLPLFQTMTVGSENPLVHPNVLLGEHFRLAHGLRTPLPPR